MSRRNSLTLAAELNYVKTYYAYTMKRFFSGLNSGFFIFRGQFVYQQLQCVPLFFIIKRRYSMTFHHHAFIFGSEARRQQISMANYAERRILIVRQGPEFLSFRSAMYIQTVFAVPNIIQRQAIGSTVSIYHRQHSIFAVSNKLQGTLFAEQAVLAAHRFVYVFHFIQKVSD